MNEKKHYYTELHATEIKESAKHYATETCLAHFYTPAKIGTIAFEEAKQEAVEFYWKQQKRGWEDYTIGKTFMQDGWREVSAMSPEWDYHRGRKFETFAEVK